MRPCTCEKDSCRLCWLYHNDETYNRAWGGDGTLRPSLWQKVANFAGAVVSHVAQGMPNVTDEQYQQRMDVCRSCDQKHDDNCRLCGCHLSIKARWASQDCPAGKWPSLLVVK